MRIPELYQCFLNCDGVSTDTRNIAPNTMFFALKGANFDGNTMAAEALEKGAAYVVMDNKQLITDEEKMLLVPNVLEALQEVAHYHRMQLGLPIIALTGSNGKTTTKELMHAVLSKKYHTIATVGNLNNHIGVPLTLLSIPEDADVALVEMGANHQKEIEQLCAIAAPDFGYITNFGRAHLEGFGGVEGVILGKSEMYTYLRKHNNRVFVNANDPLQVEKTQGMTTYSFGVQAPHAQVVFDQVSAQPMAEVHWKGHRIVSQLTGLYNVPNVCAAITVGHFFEVPVEDIIAAIENYVSTNNRSQWVSCGSTTVLLDAYNANPSSMKAALDHFAQLDRSHKFAILGDMFELGSASHQEHLTIISLVKEIQVPAYFVGEHFYACRDAAPELQFFETYENLVAHLKQFPLTDKTLLIKGSRGMSLERLTEHIQ